MAMMKKKKKKLGGGGGGGKGREESPLRPYYVRKTPPCSFACPSSEDIRGYLTWIGQAEKYGRKSEEGFDKAWEMITDKNPCPSTMGRVCPHPCEAECNRVKLDGAVGINAMERAVGDHGIEKNLPLVKLSDESHPEPGAALFRALPLCREPCRRARELHGSASRTLSPGRWRIAVLAWLPDPRGNPVRP